MAKKFTNLFCVFSVLLIFIVFTPTLILAQELRPDKDIGETARELQELIREKQAQGVDVSRALRLDRMSQEAMRAGRPDECLKLLREAIFLLEEDKGKPVRTYQALNSQKYRDSPFGFHPAIVKRKSSPYSYANDIGVKWDRPGLYFHWFMVQKNPNIKIYDWSVYDQQAKLIPEDMWFLRNITTAYGPVITNGDVPSGYLENNSWLPLSNKKDDYIDFVKAAVERYDGDGIDDMPGLKTPIKYWQVDNEPHAVIKVKGVKGYAKLLEITLYFRSFCVGESVVRLLPERFIQDSGIWQR